MNFKLALERNLRAFFTPLGNGTAIYDVFLLNQCNTNTICCQFPMSILEETRCKHKNVPARLLFVNPNPCIWL